MKNVLCRFFSCYHVSNFCFLSPLHLRYCIIVMVTPFNLNRWIQLHGFYLFNHLYLLRMGLWVGMIDVCVSLSCHFAWVCIHPSQLFVFMLPKINMVSILSTNDFLFVFLLINDECRKKKKTPLGWGVDPMKYMIGLKGENLILWQVAYNKQRYGETWR